MLHARPLNNNKKHNILNYGFPIGYTVGHYARIYHEYEDIYTVDSHQLLRDCETGLMPAKYTALGLTAHVERCDRIAHPFREESHSGSRALDENDFSWECLHLHLTLLQRKQPPPDVSFLYHQSPWPDALTVCIMREWHKKGHFDVILPAPRKSTMAILVRLISIWV